MCVKTLLHSLPERVEIGNIGNILSAVKISLAIVFSPHESLEPNLFSLKEQERSQL